MGVGVKHVDSEGTETAQNKTRHSSYLETGVELWMSAEFTEAGKERERAADVSGKCCQTPEHS